MISVIILTKNEEERIKACLESVKWADEIIVFDNDSQDKTTEIAKKYTDKIVHISGMIDYQEVRNKGMEKATGEWVLYIDADERVLANLKDELVDISKTSSKSAFAISRKNIIFGQEVSYGPYKKDWMIRYFKKNKFKTWVGKVHEYATFDGELGYSNNSLLHLTHRDVDHFILKTLNWSNIYAQLLFDSKHPNMSGWRFFRILITESFEQGIKRRGFFAGTVGVIDSLLQVFSQLITYIKLWQLQKPKKIDQIYDDIDKKLIEDNFKY